jgi:hypothetical protein
VKILNKDYLLDKFTRSATGWDEAGRPDDRLITGDKLMMIAYVWNGNRKKNPDHPRVIDEFVSAGFEKMGGMEWYDSFLRRRERCSVCFETYRIENLSVCPKCKSYYCYRCRVDCVCGLPLVG